MATLETQFRQYQYDNPNSKLNFDEWKKTILAVDMQNVIEQIIELKKLPTTQSTKLKIQKLQQQMDDSHN